MIKISFMKKLYSISKKIQWSAKTFVSTRTIFSYFVLYWGLEKINPGYMDSFFKGPEFL